MRLSLIIPARQGLVYGLAPAVILGLMPHTLTRFFTTDAHALANAFSGLLGGNLALEPLASRGDPWLFSLSLLAYLGMIWSLTTLWKRSRLLTPDADLGLRLRVWFWASLPVLLFIAIYLFKAWAFMTYGPAPRH
ncbi:MAG: hypothetical protein H7842_15260 [Gammaproteobacteria bacterium SHHR-1]